MAKNVAPSISLPSLGHTGVVITASKQTVQMPIKTCNIGTLYNTDTGNGNGSISPTLLVDSAPRLLMMLMSQFVCQNWPTDAEVVLVLAVVVPASPEL